MTTTRRVRLSALLAALAITGTGTIAAQEVTRVVVTPATITLEVGEKATVSATAYDADGNVVEVPFMYFSRGGRGRLAVDRTTGEVEAFKGGEYEVMARVLGPTRVSGDHDRRRGVPAARPDRDLRRRAGASTPG